MNRRNALQTLAAALAPFPLPADTSDIPALPDPSLADRDPEAYWLRIRNEQFLLPEQRVFLNNGSLGVTPRPVVKATCDYMERAAALLMDETDYPRWGYETLEEHRAEMAAFAGCHKDELAFTHNATEAINFIAAGVEMQAGDEVLMTDQEHPSGRSPWQMRAARQGIQVREVKIPMPPRDPAQLAELITGAIGPRTRVLFFSGITSPTGLIMPIRDICDAARAKGLITIVDGAHMNGQIPFRISDLGCDYFAGSPHKWLFAPAGCGLLYGRGDSFDRLWPSVVTGGWDNRQLKAARFMMVGTNNRAIFEGMMAGLRFARAIGAERVYQRIHQLARLARKKAEEVPFVRLNTPGDDRMFGSLVSMDIPEAAVQRLMQTCKQRKIWITGSKRLRLSTHIHTRPSDLDAFFATLREVHGA